MLLPKDDPALTTNQFAGIHTMKIQSRGFTLLEVLIALAIFAICALVILEQTSLSISQQTNLEEKTLALWVAENQFAALRLEKSWPDTGTTEVQTSSSHRDWQVQQVVEGTANPLLRKVTVSVSREDQDHSLVSLTGFIGEH